MAALQQLLLVTLEMTTDGTLSGSCSFWVCWGCLHHDVVWWCGSYGEIGGVAAEHVWCCTVVMLSFFSSRFLLLLA